MFEWRNRSPLFFAVWVKIFGTNECVKAIDSQLLSAATVNWPQTGLTNTWFNFMGAALLYRNNTNKGSRAEHGKRIWCSLGLQSYELC